jgi:DNA-binding NarL/FixJ family response regulator
MIKIILAIQDTLHRIGYLRIFEDIKNLKVVDTVDNGEKLLTLYRKHLPNLILIEVEQNLNEWIPSICLIKKVDATSKFLLLSHSFEDDRFHKLSSYEFIEYLRTNSTLGNLYSSINKLFILNSANSKFKNKSLFVAHHDYHNQGNDNLHDLSVLTKSERRIIRFLGDGFTSSEIAKSLFISRRTVENHRAHIKQKLNFNTWLDLLKFCIQYNRDVKN